jgi:hypothetical protein
MASQPPIKAESVTHVSGTICHLCLEPLTGAPKVQKSIEDRFQEMNARSASKGNPADQICGLKAGVKAQRP